MTGLKMELGEPDDSGRRRPMPIEGSEFDLECDLAIIAVVQVQIRFSPSLRRILILINGDILLQILRLEKPAGKEYGPAVILFGSATVILAMGAGRIAADSIHKYLETGS